MKRQRRRHNQQPFSRFVLCCLAGLLLAGVWCHAQSDGSPETSPPWTLEYWITGGLAGRSEHVTIRQNGETQVWGQKISGKVESKLSPEELAKMRSLVKEFKLSNRPKPVESSIPDMVSSGTTLELGGHLYYAGPEEKELAEELHLVFLQKAKEAEDEKWAKAGPFRLGRIWHVTEEIRDRQGQFHGDSWLGTWTRRSDTNLFDAAWHNSRTGEEMKDVVQLDLGERGRVSLHRLGTKQIYQGLYLAERMNAIYAGSISASGSPGCSWWATIEE